MKKHVNQDTLKTKLCVDCFNCKTKNRKVYCKIGVWKEDDNSKSILHSPYDFDCPKWEEA